MSGGQIPPSANREKKGTAKCSVTSAHPPLTKHSTEKLQIFEHVSVVASLRYLYNAATTTLSILLQTILDGKKRQKCCGGGQHTDRKSQTKPRHTASYCRRKPDSSASSENLQPNSATSLTRDSDCRSILTEEGHIQREVTCPSPLTQFFFVYETLQERTASMMRRRAQDGVLHIVLTFLMGGESHLQHPKTVLPSSERQKQRAKTFSFTNHLPPRVHSRLVQNIPRLFANAAVGFFEWIAQRSSLTGALVLISFSWPASQKFTPLNFVSFMAHSTVASLFS